MNFWTTRIAMLVWGMLTVYFFTGNVNVTSKVFVVQAIGNTLIMAGMKKTYGK